jgi:hypothetical protein
MVAVELRAGVPVTAVARLSPLTRPVIAAV